MEIEVAICARQRELYQIEKWPLVYFDWGRGTPSYFFKYLLLYGGRRARCFFGRVLCELLEREMIDQGECRIQEKKGVSYGLVAY